LARPVKQDGGLYKRDGSKVWWKRYHDKDGVRQRESTLTEDWGEAQKCLRERLQARDDNTLPALRRGQDIAYGERADFIWRTSPSRRFERRRPMRSTGAR